MLQLRPFLLCLVCLLGLMTFRLEASSQKSFKPFVLGTPLPAAHAHNDYLHPRPLLDALEQGFCSIEADIHLVDGALLVAHDLKDCKPERTLESLYLKPLAEIAKRNGGRIYPNGEPLLLLIDIKSNGNATYPILKKVLEKYKRILTTYTDNKVTQHAVNVILSGSRPIEMVREEKVRLCGIDGRLSDLDKAVSPALMPLISDSWFGNFTWFGNGAMPDDQRKKLQEIVSKAKAGGFRLRFWAIPNTPTMWGTLHDAGVDLLNADNLVGLKNFLKR